MLNHHYQPSSEHGIAKVKRRSRLVVRSSVPAAPSGREQVRPRLGISSCVRGPLKRSGPPRVLGPPARVRRPGSPTAET